MISTHNQNIKYNRLTFLKNPCDYAALIQASDRQLWHKFTKQFRSSIDDDKNAWRCEYWGKVMRGACVLQKLTDNSTLYKILEETVRDMLTTQDSLGRFSTYSVANEFHGWDLWGRKYVMLGFIYFLHICQNDDLRSAIIEALRRHADYITERIGDEDRQVPIYKTSSIWLGINSSSILEPFVLLYDITGEKRYLDFSHYIVNSGMAEGFDLPGTLLEGKTYPYQFPTTKAYEMMSCVEGMLELYRIEGDERYLKIAENFVQLVRKSDITIIGCAGCSGEQFNNAVSRQTYTKHIGIMQETCVTVTWMKLCSKLLMLTGNPVYADEMEKSYYNAYLGAVNYDLNGKNQGLPYDSYSPLLYGSRGAMVGGRQTINGDEYYGCCAAIASLGAVIFAYGSVIVRGDAIMLNFFDTLEAETTDGLGTVIKEQSSYPYTNTAEIHITGCDSRAVLLRIPGWCKKANVAYNGHCYDAKPGYFHIERNNTPSLDIHVEFDMPVEIHEPVGCDDDPDSFGYIALTRGPVVLAADSRVTGDEVGGSIPIAVAHDCNGYAISAPAETSVRHNVALDIKTNDGGKVTLIDYACAGCDWDNGTKLAAWLKV